MQNGDGEATARDSPGAGFRRRSSVLWVGLHWGGGLRDGMVSPECLEVEKKGRSN